MQKPLNPTWNLDSIFPGGSASSEYEAFLQELEQDIKAFREEVVGTQTPQTEAEAFTWSERLLRIQDLQNRIKQASAFVSCLTAQNVKDEAAKLLSGRTKQISAAFNSVMNTIDDQIIHMPQSIWDNLLQNESVAPISFPLEERRTRAKEKLSPEQESLANDLAISGYHGWSDMYNTIVGRMSIPFEQNGKVEQLSMGQAENKMSSGDRSIRQAMFQKWEEAWGKEADLFGNTLNHLAGFRLNLYKHRGWDSVLKEPLNYNRMSEQTLNTMWDTIDKNKNIFVEFLNHKAKLLGVDQLSWHDVSAPISAAAKSVTYEEAADFIVEHFGRFSPKLAEFAVRNFEERWVEAENRPGKRPGGFCTSFPLSQESRIFMTFGGSVSNVATLAHELGHAYHQHVMNDLPPLAQNYAMNVAETASTFAEMIVADAAVKAAQSQEEKLTLLEDKIRRSIAFFMNIHARFIFETNFYDARKKGLVSVQKLNELMVNAQKQAFRESLADYHPHFWAAKLHFHITYVPFYNFPYTFGYLFSSGVYARALQEGPGFEQKYVALLRDTGRMTVEDLAKKHLGVEITKPEFWQSAIDLAVADVKEFLDLTK